MMALLIMFVWTDQLCHSASSKLQYVKRFYLNWHWQFLILLPEQAPQESTAW